MVLKLRTGQLFSVSGLSEVADIQTRMRSRSAPIWPDSIASPNMTSLRSMNTSPSSMNLSSFAAFNANGTWPPRSTHK